MRGLEGGRWKSAHPSNSLAAYLTFCIREGIRQRGENWEADEEQTGKWIRKNTDEKKKELLEEG